MLDETKNLIDVILAVVGGVGALIAFVHTLRTWKEGQRWRRADKLDELIETFEKEPLVKLACVVFDWTNRKTEVDGKDFVFTNEDVLLALRLHGDGPGQTRQFSPTQAKIRDACDAFLNFFSRLDAALDAGLIDSAPARRYFVYWLEVALTMKHHPDEASVHLLAPSQTLANYIHKYGNPNAIATLASAWGLGSLRPQIPAPNSVLRQTGPSLRSGPAGEH